MGKRELVSKLVVSIVFSSSLNHSLISMIVAHSVHLHFSRCLRKDKKYCSVLSYPDFVLVVAFKEL